MGLKETIQDAADNLVEVITYTSVGAVTYAPSTGTVTQTNSTTTQTFLFQKFTAEDVHGVYKKAKDFAGENILPTDVKATIPQINFKNGATPIIPKPDDLMVRADSSSWEVVMIDQDPADAMWNLLLRKRA